MVVVGVFRASGSLIRISAILRMPVSLPLSQLAASSLHGHHSRSGADLAEPGDQGAFGASKLRGL